MPKIHHTHFFIRTNFIRTPRLRFAQKQQQHEQAENNHKAEILIRQIYEIYLILVHRLGCTCIQRLVRIGWVIGRWSS